jgi:hypothetical protein
MARGALVGMAHHDDRTDRRPRQVRLLGAQCQRRPGYQRHRAAHGLELRIQRQARTDRGETASSTPCPRSATRPATAPSISTSRPVSRWRCCSPPNASRSERRCNQQVGGATEHQPGKDCDRSNRERNDQCSKAHAILRVFSSSPHCVAPPNRCNAAGRLT